MYSKFRLISSGFRFAGANCTVTKYNEPLCSGILHNDIIFKNISPGQISEFPEILFFTDIWTKKADYMKVCVLSYYYIPGFWLDWA